MLWHYLTNIRQSWRKRHHTELSRIPVKAKVNSWSLPTTSQKILTSFHDSMDHQGAEQTLYLIRDYCYWPGMPNDAEAWIKQCEKCTLPSFGYFLTTKPLEVLAIDFTLLEPAKDGRESVFGNDRCLYKVHACSSYQRSKNQHQS